MAPEILGEGVLLVSVKQDVDREMKEAEAAFERSRRRMDRKRATMELDANLAPLQKKVDQAEKKIEEYKRRVADDANLGLDTSKAERNLKDWERKLHERRTARDEVNLDTDKARKQLAALQQLEDDRAANAQKLQSAVAKGEKKLADARIAQSKRTAKAIKDAEEKATKSRIAEENKRTAAGKKAVDAQIRDEAKRMRSAISAQNKITATRLKEEAKIRREADRTAAANAKALQSDRDNMAGLLQDYAKLQRRIDGLRRNRRTFTGMALPSRRASLDLDISAAENKAEILARRLEDIGVDKKRIIDIEVREKNTGAIHRLISGLSDASVRIGPFTASVGGAIRALTLLAPIIVGVVGALGALTGAISAGLVGGVGILASGFAGLIPLLAGTVFAVKPMISEFKLAVAAQTNLHKAVLKYGAGSKEAKKAQDQLNNTLKGMDPSARRAVKSFDRIKSKWKDVTQSTARQQFGRVIGQATKTAEANVKMFGKQTNRTMKTLGDGISNAMKGLRTKGAKSGIATVLTNVNNALPSLLAGLGNLAVAFGNVIKSFSRGSVLGAAAKSFEDWTERVRKGTEDTSALNKKVDTLSDAFRKTVGFVSALAGFLKTLFGAGVKPGVGLLQDMTDGLNKMTASMKGPGKAGLDDFFKNSVDDAQLFFETIKPFLQLFMEWATIMRPVAHNLLTIIKPIGQFTREVLKWKPIRAIIVGVFTALLAGKAIGGVRNLAREVGLLGRSLRNLKVPGALSKLGGWFGFGGKGKPKPTTGPGTTGGGRATPVPLGGGHAGHEPGVQSVRIVGPLPVPVEIVGGVGGVGGGKGGGKGGGGGGPLILPGGGPDPKDVPKTRGRFAKFFEKVFGGIKKIPGMGKVLGALTAGLSIGKGFGSKLLSPFTKVFGGVFGKLGGVLKPMLGRVLGRGVFAGLGKIIGKFVPVLGWGWLIHDMLPDSPRQAIDKVLGDGFSFIGDSIKSNFEGALRTGGNLWSGLTGGATAAWDFIKRKTTDGLNTIKGLVSKPLNFSIGLKDKVKSGASSAVNFLGKQASKGFKISLGLKDNVKAAAGRVFSWIGNQAKKGVRFSLGLRDNLKGAAARIMSGVSGLAHRGGRYALGLLDHLKGAASNVMGGVSATARRGAKFALGLLDKLSSQASRIFNTVRQAASAGATFTIRVVANVVGDAAKFIGKGYNALQSLRPAQGSAPGISNSTIIHRRAQGGSDDSTLSDRMMNRRDTSKLMNALEMGTRTVPRPAKQTPWGKVSGQKVSRPTYLVGEENRKEYVVSTNPAYKGRNQKIVSMAARDLGMNVTSAAQGSYGNPDGPGYYANTNVSNLSSKKSYSFNSKRTKKQKATARKRARKGLSPAALNNPWGAHIKGLLDQQSDWEREASIRENAVSEPEDYINEVKNPDGTTTYELDNAAIAAYKAQVKEVADAYLKLTQITQEIVQSIPKAIQSMKAEISGHNYNIGVLTHEINREEDRLRTKGKGTKVEAIKDSARSRLKKLRPALSAEKRAKEVAKGLRDEFSGDTRKEAGFDYREFTATYAGLLAELGDGKGSIQADAAAQLASASDTGAGGPGDGGGDAPLAYGAQQLIADTEKMNLLREYGGNAYTTSPSGSSATSPGGGGYIGNPAGTSDPARSNSTLSASTSASAGDGGGAMTRSMASGSASASTWDSGGAASSGGATSTVAPSKTITITNNFETAPEDPHLWSQGMAFEVNTAI